MFLMKFNVECRQNHVWGVPVAQVMSIFVKTCIFAKDALGETHGKKALKTILNGVLKKQNA